MPFAEPVRLTTLTAFEHTPLHKPSDHPSHTHFPSGLRRMLRKSTRIGPPL